MFILFTAVFICVVRQERMRGLFIPLILFPLFMFAGMCITGQMLVFNYSIKGARYLK